MAFEKFRGKKFNGSTMKEFIADENISRPWGSKLAFFEIARVKSFPSDEKFFIPVDEKEFINPEFDIRCGLECESSGLTNRIPKEKILGNELLDVYFYLRNGQEIGDLDTNYIFKLKNGRIVEVVEYHSDLPANYRINTDSNHPSIGA